MSRSGSELCTQCGICCDGSWLDYVPLEADEVQSAEAMGLKLKHDRHAFELPCPCHQSCRCTVYDRRPRACATFECGLLRKFMQGERTLEECLTTVGRAKGLVRTIEDAGESLPGLRAKLRTFLTDDDRVHLIRANSDWVLKCLALITLLRREFGDIGRAERGTDDVQAGLLHVAGFVDNGMRSVSE